MKNSKITKYKAEKAKQFKLINQQRHQEIKDALTDLYELINGKEIHLNWDQLIGQIRQIKPVVNISNDLTEIEAALKNLKVSQPDKVQVKDLETLIKAVKQNRPIETKFDIEPLKKAIIQVRQRIEEQSKEKDPTDFKPFRRVIKVGNRLVYDDRPTSSGGGGGVASLEQTKTGMLPFEFDDMQFSNPDGNGNYQTIVVKLAGSTQATLTLTFDGNDKVTSIVRT